MLAPLATDLQGIRVSRFLLGSGAASLRFLLLQCSKKLLFCPHARVCPNARADNDLTNYTVPSPLTMSRMLYITEDLNGTVIPASAYLLWPSSPLEVPTVNSSSNSTQWPMVAWAHGTSGGLSPCAPSNYRNLQYHFQVPFTLALQGYVVVAHDYAGLGVGKLPNGEDIGHPWAAWPAQANDIENAIKAARNAFPQFLQVDGPFIAMGHSQGAASVWSFTERQVNRPVAGYQGAVALAPPPGAIEQVRRARSDHAKNKTQLWTNAYLSFQTPLIKGITVAYPSLNLTGMTELGWDRWVNVQEAVQGCLPTKQVASIGAPIAELAYRNWTEHPTVLEFENRTAFGRKSFKGPLLIMSGDLDSITNINSLKETVRDTCEASEARNAKQSLELAEYSRITSLSSRPARLSGLSGLGTGSSHLEINLWDAVRKLSQV